MTAFLWATTCARHIGQCLLFPLILMGSAWSADANSQDSDELIYEKAQLYLHNGNTAEAIKNLSIIVERSPIHMGAVLDLAIAYCQSNRQLEAQALFYRLIKFPELPPVIAELVSYYQENCRVNPSTWRGFATVGVGHANNLNQGPVDEYFFLAPLGLTLQLAKGTRPRNDGFRVVEAGVSRSNSQNSWYGGLFFQDIDYNGSNDYDNFLSNAKIGYRFKKYTFNLEVLGNINHLSLGQKSYLTTMSTSISAMRPVSHDGSWEVGGVGSLTDRNYLKMPDYRAHVVDARGLIQWRPSADMRFLGEIGLIQDTAIKNRPGGNSRGRVFQLTGQWQLTPRQLLEVFHSQTSMSEQTPYSPAFFGDVKRRPNLASWYAAWRYQLREDLQLRLTARYGSNQDTLNFFDYRTSTLGVALEWLPK